MGGVMNVTFRLLLIGLWLTLGVRAQDARVLVRDVVDTRATVTGSFEGGCDVELRVVGVEGGVSNSIRGVRIRSATDDTERDLSNPEPRHMPPQVTRVDDAGVLATHVQLRNPSRSASVIKVLEGEIDLFHPTTENGGKILLKNFQAHPGEIIDSPDLKQAGIQLIFVTRETEETAQKRLQEDLSKDNAAPKPNDVSDMQRLLLRRSMEPAGMKNPVRFIFNDPEGKLVGIDFLDGSGIPIMQRGSSRGSGFLTKGFDKELPANALAIVYLATPGAVTTVPFELENIPLP
jgi:hypothetical protein